MVEFLLENVFKKTERQKNKEDTKLERRISINIIK